MGLDNITRGQLSYGIQFNRPNGGLSGCGVDAVCLRRCLRRNGPGGVRALYDIMPQVSIWRLAKFKATDRNVSRRRRRTMVCGGGCLPLRLERPRHTS